MVQRIDQSKNYMTGASKIIIMHVTGVCLAPPWLLVVSPTTTWAGFSRSSEHKKGWNATFDAILYYLNDHSDHPRRISACTCTCNAWQLARLCSHIFTDVWPIIQTYHRMQAARSNWSTSSFLGSINNALLLSSYSLLSRGCTCAQSRITPDVVHVAI